MEQNKNYLNILIESLQKKIQVLDQISGQNRLQAELSRSPEWDEEAFDATMDSKDQLILQLEQLDKGFETVYERVKAELDKNREKYRNEIQQLQQLIETITEKTVAIEVEEKRNRDLIATKFSSLKKDIQKKRTSNKVASDYYQSMAKVNPTASSYLDTKK